MKIHGRRLYALNAYIGAALLTACSGSPSRIGEAGAIPQSVVTGTATESIVHSFGATNDGISPSAKLLNFSGTLYGTTVYGGTHDDGMVFAITTTGSETVLHNFGGSRTAPTRLPA